MQRQPPRIEPLDTLAPALHKMGLARPLGFSMPGFNPPLRDLVSLLDDAVKRHGARPLLGEKRGGRWVFISYADFAGQVDAARAGLAGLGVGRGDRVAIVSGNSVPWATAR